MGEAGTIPYAARRLACLMGLCRCRGWRRGRLCCAVPNGRGRMTRVSDQLTIKVTHHVTPNGRAIFSSASPHFRRFSEPGKLGEKSDHEPSLCRRGMWLHTSRMSCIAREPNFLAADAGAADRIQAPGSGGKDIAGPELPHALRA